MTLTEPTLAPPMAPSTVDRAQIFAAHAERAARIDALRPGNKDRLFDGLIAAGITHVTVTFDGAGASGQIESIAPWSGETAVEFPATEIDYAALTWDDPEVEMRQLSLEDVVEQLAYDFLSDTHGGWENTDGAYGEFCFDATARCTHLEFNERFTSSELYALTWSRARLDAFGGGAHVLDPGARKSIGWTSTQERLAAALNGDDADV